MKNEFVHFLFPATVLALAAAFESALPRVLSVGFPLLMVSAVFLAEDRTRVERVLLAAAAGALADALGALPLATTASYLLIVSLCARLTASATVTLIAAYPVYQVWLAVWSGFPAGALWGRLLVSVPVAAVTVFALRPALRSLERRVAADAR